MADNDNDPLGGNDSGSTTPLLFLLDGVLSQDEDRVSEAVTEIARLIHPFDKQSSSQFAFGVESPCTSQVSLCHVLSSLLTHCPEYASKPSEHDGSLPLHFAASLGNVKVASLILSKYPQAACTPNQKGKIPLHYAAREGRVEMVHYFLHAAPETAAIATDKGKLAVHFSAGDGHVAITSALLRQYPQSAALPSTKGKLPLHFCARWGYLEIAHELLGVYPDAVRALDWEGSLPLHDAAREGQYRMSRYLIERFPVALQTANLRGEIPLFPAVRSASLDLVALMLQAWPMGGKHILRNVSADDSVSSWNWDILELLLRGAVNNLRGCALLEGREPPTVQLTDDVQPVAIASPEELKAKKKAKKAKKSEPQHQQPRLVEAPHRWVPAAAAEAPFASLTSSSSSSSSYTSTSLPAGATSSAYASVPVRSKSPILSKDCSGSSSSCLGGSRKKHVRKRSCTEESPYGGMAVERTFIPLHASFESESACHVIRHVLHEHPEAVTMKDERGRLPLHWAVTHCHNQDAIVDLVLSNDNDILTPEAACTADSTGKLPLHLAICSRASVRVITALLDAHPAAGVEPCHTMDIFYDKTPIHLAAHYGCDLSTVFELLRVDPSFVSQGR